MSPNDIPEEQTDHFPSGVSEHVYPTARLIEAFVAGVNVADALDVQVGQIFTRNGEFVVRVQVGDWEQPDAI